MKSCVVPTSRSRSHLFFPPKGATTIRRLQLRSSMRTNYVSLWGYPNLAARIGPKSLGRLRGTRLRSTIPSSSRRKFLLALILLAVLPSPGPSGVSPSLGSARFKFLRIAVWLLAIRPGLQLLNAGSAIPLCSSHKYHLVLQGHVHSFVAVDFPQWGHFMFLSRFCFWIWIFVFGSDLWHLGQLMKVICFEATSS